MKPSQKHGQTGFTMVELAVVLVIIGLIVGGIMLGRHLVRAAELNSVLTEWRSYTAAMQQFKTKYLYLPGDFPRAESFWGSDATCPNTGTNTVKKTATCNGDGNGSISAVERFRFWQQLADAGLITGSYSGVAADAGGVYALPGNNVPASRLSGGGYSLWNIGYQAGGSGYYQGNYQHSLYFGAPVSGSITMTPILTSEEAHTLDLKADDGLPAYGNILSAETGMASGCATSDTPSVAVYSTAVGGFKCFLLLKMGF